MNPSSRISAAIDILERISTSRIPMDGTIGDYMRNRRYIGAKDRANIVERAYNIVRHYARIVWHLEDVKADHSPRTHMIVWLSLGEGLEPAQVRQLFNGSKNAPAVLDEDELKLLDRLRGRLMDMDAMPNDVRVECPPAYTTSLKTYFGGAFMTEMAALMKNAPLDLRVNTRHAQRDDVRTSLAEDEIISEPTARSPWGLRVTGKAFISKTKAFAKGWIDIQDEGSQLIALACGAQPGMQVLDYCAGGGGKTLALAAAMQNKGRIVAMDIEPARLEKGRQRFRRAGVSDIIEVRPLTDEKNRKWLRRQKETFDVVLTDVPCTGTGTWRRNPDMRWRTYGPDLAALLPIQAEILDKVAGCVKPGGKLVYATCSLLPEENEEQVAAFLSRHPEFEVIQQEATEERDTPFMRLTPYRHNTDGFFAAVLQKKTG